MAPRFVDEHQSLRIEVTLPCDELGSLLRDIEPITLWGVRSFF